MHHIKCSKIFGCTYGALKIKSFDGESRNNNLHSHSPSNKAGRLVELLFVPIFYKAIKVIFEFNIKYLVFIIS